MAISYSTCLVNRLAGEEISVLDGGSQISFTAPDIITTTQSDFITQGFRPGQIIKVTDGGSSTNAGLYTVDTVTATVITTIEQTISTEAAAVDTPTLSVPTMMNWLSIFRYSIFDVYDGSGGMPADADAAELGVKLLSMTLDGGTFTAGASANGIEFEFVSAGKIQLKTGDTYQDDGIATGTAYYGRLYDNGYITGNDASNLQSCRIQGRVATSGQDFDITSTSVVISVTNTLRSFNITLPTS